MPESASWHHVSELITGRDHDALTEAVSVLDDATRKTMIGPLRTLARRLTTRENGRWFDGAVLSIAGAGILPNASSTATWISRHGLFGGARWGAAHSPEYTWETQFEHGGQHERADELRAIARIMRVLSARQVDWLDSLAERLAHRLPPRPPVAPVYHLVEQLRSHTGMAPPVSSDGYVAQWALTHGQPDSIHAAVASDPRLLAVLPRLFDVDAVATELSWFPDFAGSLAAVVTAPSPARDATLDAAIGRLQRGGRPGASRVFFTMLVAMAPTLDEVNARIADYVELIASALSVAATTAQEALAALDAEGRLPRRALVDASRAALARTEKKIVRAQLRWITRVIDGDPSAAGPLMAVVPTVFEHPATDLQRSGVTLVEKHAHALDDDARRQIGEHATVLPADLEQRVGVALGTGSGVVTSSAVAPQGPPPRHRLARIGSREELAEELLRIVVGGTATVADLERPVEALVRYAADDCIALRAALMPVTRHDVFSWLSRRPEWPADVRCPAVTLDNALGELIGAALEHERHDWIFAHCGHHADGLDHVVIHRVLHLADAVRAGSTRDVVSFPTWTNGLIDAADLVERLRAAELAGYSPEPVDLDQALLRIDRATAHGTVLRRCADLRGPAATALADWLRAAPPDPPRYRTCLNRRRTWDAGRETVTGTFTDLAIDSAAAHVDNWIWTEVLEPRDDGALELEWSGVSPGLWPGVFPGHREIVCAHVASLIAGDPALRARVPELVALAELDGELGCAFWLALAYAMAGKDAGPRIDAVDACAILAARQQLDGRAFGAVLGDLIVRRHVVVTRLVLGLRDAAAAGIGEQLWPATVTALDAVLSAGQDLPNGMADLFAVAADLASSVAPAGAEIAGLRAFAARSGRSRQLVEARRLLGMLDA